MNGVTSTGAGTGVDALEYNCFAFFINASSVTTGGTVKIQALSPAGDWVDLSETAVTADGDTQVTKVGAFLQVRANVTARTDGTYTVTMVAKEGEINEVAAAAESKVSTASLVSYWKLDEISGTRYDFFGSNHLTDYNTVGQGTGEVYDNAADFEATNSEYLSITDGSLSGIDFDGDWAVCFWVKFETTASQVLFSQDDYGTGTASDRSINILYSGTNNRFEGYLFSGAAFNIAAATTFGSASTGVWYFVCWQHESGVGHTISIDGGGVDSSAYTSTINDSTTALLVGGHLNNGSAESTADALMGPVMLYQRLLSSAEITALANKDDPFYDQF